MTKKLTRPLTEAEWNALLDKRVQKHIAIEVRKVARRWHLNTEETAELGSHVLGEIAVKVARFYDATQQNMNSFVRIVLPDILVDWKEETYQYQTTLVPVGDMLELAEKSQSKGTAASPLEREVLSALNLLAYEKEEDASMLGKTPFEILAEKDDRRYTRWVIAKLSSRNQQICRMYIETPNLRKVARRMHITWSYFQGVIWLACQKEFKKIWGQEEILVANKHSQE